MTAPMIVVVNASVQLVGVDAAAAAVGTQLQLAGVLSTAETAGAMPYLFDLTVQYCKDRIAFGRPIGSFQAIKHQLADSSLALEMSHAVVSAAARAVQEDSAGAAHAASMTKAFVSDAAVEQSQSGLVRGDGSGSHTAEDYLPELALQKKLHEAGYAGINWPRE